MVNLHRMNFVRVLVDLEYVDDVVLVMKEIFVEIYYLLMENILSEMLSVDEQFVSEMENEFDAYEIYLDLDDFLIMTDPEKKIKFF
jgi:hypothetical protein